MAYSYVLNDDEKRELLRIARATLREYFDTQRIPPGKPHRDSLTAEAAAFVSLHQEGKLRGCIGMQQEIKPVYRVIQEMAIAAATRDPRFPPITEEELEDVEIEISVLGANEPVRAAGDVQIGEHGLAIECDGKRGLLLPQVAKEAGWSAEEFLRQVCLKAGLPDSAWTRADAKVERFTAQIFSDATHPPRRMTFF